MPRDDRLPLHIWIFPFGVLLSELQELFVMRYLSFALVFFGCHVFGQNVVYIPAVTEAAMNAKVINTSLSVGAIAGSASVNSIGAATYSIPLAIPPAANGFAPSLALGYNSNSGDGPLGLGWSLSGMSAISRDGADHYHDEVFRPVSNSASDFFALDGQRLVPTNGYPYGQLGTHYDTEASRYLIVQVAQFENGEPDYFKVVDKAGTTSFYGYDNGFSDGRVRTEDGTRTLSWLLTMQEDPFGNKIKYNYLLDDDEPRLASIYYDIDGSPTVSHTTAVLFQYRTRSDDNVSFVNGRQFHSSRLLTRIVVESTVYGGLREYVLNYAQRLLGRSFLSEIRDRGMNGEEVNSTIFRYGEEADALAPETTLNSNFVGDNVDLFTGDFDGNGVDDLLASSWNYINGGAKAISNFAVYLNGSITSSFTKNFSGETYHLLTKALRLSDINGDGRDDILVQNVMLTEAPNKYELLGFERFLSTTIGSTATFDQSYIPNVTNPYRWFLPEKFDRLQLGDFDGDGRTDVVFFGTDQLWNVLRCTLWSGGSVQSIILPPLSNGSDFSLADRINALNINGDAQAELQLRSSLLQSSMIVRLNPVGTDWQTVSIQTGPGFDDNETDLDEFDIAMGDFNGDGNSDVLHRIEASFKIYLANGVGFEPARTFVMEGGYQENNSQVVVADFNGDGRSDVFHGRFQAGVGNVARVAWSQGVSTDGDPIFLWDNWTNSNRYTSLGVGDINGDGRMDLLNRHFFQSPVELTTFGALDKERCLVAVKDGLLNMTEFEYSGIYDATVYSINASFYQYPYGQGTFPLNLVKRIRQPNGTAAGRYTSFDYANGFGWWNGPGFNGFLKVTSLDELSQVQVFDEYEWQSVAGLYLETRTISDLHIQPAQVLSERVSFNAAITQGAMRRYVPFTSTILETDGLRGLTTTTTPQLDAVSGNLIGTTSTIPGLFQQVENYDYGNFGPLFPFGYNNRMTGRTITTTRSGSNAHVDEHQWTYDYYTGAMITDVAFANTSAPIVHEVTRRSQRGEVEEEGKYYVGQDYEDQRWSIHTYDPIHVGPISSTTTWYSPDGPVQAITQMINTPSRSGPDYSIGTDGLRVDNLYDGFGRLIATSAPTATGPARYWSEFQRVWDLTTVPGAVYYTEVDDPGAPLMREYFDNLGRSVEKWSRMLSGAWSRSRVEYDGLGRIWRTKEPSFQGEADVWTTFGYDELERPTTVTHPLTGTATTTYVYDAGLLTTTTTSSSGRWSSVTTDATGAKVASADDGGELAYRYDSRGLLTKVLKAGVVLAEMTYDDYGHRSGLQDASAGFISYNTDPLGRPLSTYSANGQTTIFHHDNLGRLVGRDGPEGAIKIVYEHDGGTRMSDRVVLKESPGVIDEYEYNDLGLLTRTKRAIENEAPFSHRMEYDEWDRLLTTDYGETTVQYEYGNGHLGSIFDPTTQEAYWKGIEMDARGRYTRYALLDGLERRDYTGNHLIRIHGEATFDMRYSWNHQTGDLIDRWDAKHGVKESFLYDQLDRLTRATVNTVDQNGNVTGLVSENRFMYDGQLGATHGDLVRKDGVGKMPFYQAAAVTALVNSNWPQDLTTPPTGVNLEMQQVDYTSYHQPSRIRERVGNAEHDLTIKYGPNDQRVLSLFRETNSGSVERRTYFGEHERQVLPNGSTHDLIYVQGGTGLCAMIVISSGDVQRYAVHTDHLGSLVMVTRGQGQQMQYTAKQSFDPWGRPRDPITWTQTVPPAQPTWLYRGYTGHEHLQPFALINMNGRLYDPLNGRMLSVDEYVQAATGTQGFNRYSYAGNNPLRYTDPSGEFLHILIGAAVGGVINLGMKAWNGQIGGWGDGFAAFGIGAIAGGLGAATGGAAFVAAGGGAAGMGGFAAGAAGGVWGSAVSMPVQSAGNMAYFGDAPMTPKQFLVSMVVGGAVGGTANGILANVSGRSFWSGQKSPTPTLSEVAPTTLTVQTDRVVHTGVGRNKITIETRPEGMVEGLPTNQPINQAITGISPAQSRHIIGPGYIEGRSVLTVSPEDLLAELHAGYSFDYIPEFQAVQFSRNIGIAVSQDGSLRQVTNMARIHWAPSTGLAHFVPYFPFGL